MARHGLVRLAVVLAALVVAPSTAGAQVLDIASQAIIDAYVNSFTNEVKLIPSNLRQGQINIGPAGLTEVSSALVVETAGFPIGSSSGGFTYRFDATSGAEVRTSPSFGPAFAERALTSGRGKWDLGFTYLHRSFDKVEGKTLDDDSLKYHTPVAFVNTGGNADLIESSFRLKLKSDTALFFATYGVLDNLDVSLAVPVQHVSVEADVQSQLVRFGPTSTAFSVPAGNDSQTKDASGVGDVAVRAKYNVFKRGSASIAGGLDLRLPTGNDVNLLGTGRVRSKIYAAAGTSMGRLFPHANLGYTFKSKKKDNDEFFFGSEVSYAVGAEYVMNPRLTIVGDIIGRSLADEGRLQDKPATYDLVAVTATNSQGQTTNVAAETKSYNELQFVSGKRLNTTLASIGAKFNPRSTFVVSGHVLLRLNNAGIRANVTPVIGVDYSF